MKTGTRRALESKTWGELWLTSMDGLHRKENKRKKKKKEGDKRKRRKRRMMRRGENMDGRKEGGEKRGYSGSGRS